MVGYWLVIALMVCALTAVVIAGATIGDDEPHPGHRRPSQTEPGARDGESNGTSDAA